MTEAIRPLFRQPGLSTPASERTFSHEPAQAANGAALRWTPGPDELRLPSSEDEPVSQNTRQLVAIVDCFDSLRLHWRGRPDVFVGADQFVYWDRDYDSRKNPANWPPSPDVYVAFGVANRHRGSYVVWEEGKPPDFVLEIVSPSSRRRDREEKPLLYAKMGVPEFFLYDPQSKRTPALSGFELQDGRYVRLPEEQLAESAIGVRSKMLGLYLCVRPSGPEPLDGALCWYNPATGEFLPTRHELEARAEASEAKLEAAEAQVESAVAEVAELKALIEKMRRS